MGAVLKMAFLRWFDRRFFISKNTSGKTNYKKSRE